MAVTHSFVYRRQMSEFSFVKVVLQVWGITFSTMEIHLCNYGDSLMQLWGFTLTRLGIN